MFDERNALSRRLGKPVAAAPPGDDNDDELQGWRSGMHATTHNCWDDAWRDVHTGIDPSCASGGARQPARVVDNTTKNDYGRGRELSIGAFCWRLRLSLIPNRVMCWGISACSRPICTRENPASGGPLGKCPIPAAGQLGHNRCNLPRQL